MCDRAVKCLAGFVSSRTKPGVANCEVDVVQQGGGARAERTAVSFVGAREDKVGWAANNLKAGAVAEAAWRELCCSLLGTVPGCANRPAID